MGSTSVASSNRPRLKIGIIGTGLRTTCFLGYFANNPGHGEIVGVCDIYPEKAEFLVNHYKIDAPVFDSAEKMIDATSPEAVIICTPDFAHVEASVLALSRNIHVLCEKPMATTLEDCDTIIEAAKKSSAIFYLGFNLRHGPVHSTVHEIISRGDIGKVTSIEANEYYYGGKTYFRRWNRLEKFGGGLWVTKACHDFDLLNWMVGAEPESVYAVANLSHYKPKAGAAMQCRDCKFKFECPDYYDIFNKLSNTDEELWRELRLIVEAKGAEPGDLCLFNSDKDTFDNGIAVVTYKNDIRTTYTVNVLAAQAGGTRQMRIIGTDGMLEASMRSGLIEVIERHSDRVRTYDVSEQMKSSHGGADDRMIADWLHTIHTGKKPKSSWAEGRLAVQVAIAARESTKSRSEVRF